VQDCAQGGMVLLGEATFTQLAPPELLDAGVLVAHMGGHVLPGAGAGGDDDAQQLYAAMHESLLPR
jgi:hypothetical protein